MEATLNRPGMPLSRIRRNPNNPRGKNLTRADWEHLVPSIKEVGVVQSVLLRPIADDATGDWLTNDKGELLTELVAGECRYMAAMEAHGEGYEIPYEMREMSDSEAFLLATVENMHRKPMNPAKEAEACQQIVLNLDGDKEEAAKRLGWSVDLLERRLGLMACTQAVRDALVNDQIKLGHAELLAVVPPVKQDGILKMIVEKNVAVAVLKQQLGQFACRLSDAPFDTAQCGTCPHNSARQTEMFGESLGEGYCTNPQHFEELAMAQVDAIAAGYKDTYQVVRIVKPKDGFIPLAVREDGPTGVGGEQYEACKGCASYGCSVSAMPGSYGTVEESLCFNAECNTKKIAAHRKATREAVQPKPTAGDNKQPQGVKAAPPAAPKPAPATNKLSPRIDEYRKGEWRKWVAKEMMIQKARNQRVMVAALLSSHQSEFASAEFRDAVQKITGLNVGANLFEGALRDAERIEEDKLGTTVEAFAATLAFRIAPDHLESLLNYLEVDEAKHFKLNETFLELHTKSELESLAGELKLKKAMGEDFAKASNGKKGDFIKALLGVSGFDYAGLVPKSMKFKRKLAGNRKATANPGEGEAGGGTGEAGNDPTKANEQAAAA